MNNNTISILVKDLFNQNDILVNVLEKTEYKLFVEFCTTIEEESHTIEALNSTYERITHLLKHDFFNNPVYILLCEAIKNLNNTPFWSIDTAYNLEGEMEIDDVVYTTTSAIHNISLHKKDIQEIQSLITARKYEEDEYILLEYLESLIKLYECILWEYLEKAITVRQYNHIDELYNNAIQITNDIVQNNTHIQTSLSDSQSPLLATITDTAFLYYTKKTNRIIGLYTILYNSYFIKSIDALENYTILCDQSIDWNKYIEERVAIQYSVKDLFKETIEEYRDNINSYRLYKGDINSIERHTIENYNKDIVNIFDIVATLVDIYRQQEIKNISLQFEKEKNTSKNKQ